VCLAVIVWRHVSNKLAAFPFVLLLCVVPVAVGISRMYRGMHFATDVAFGALGGLLWLLVVLGVLWPRGDDLRDPARRPAQEVAAP
jgi:undecaprenyl-diphosphatase